jgi:hypothetical protein
VTPTQHNNTTRFSSFPPSLPFISPTEEIDVQCVDAADLTTLIDGGSTSWWFQEASLEYDEGERECGHVKNRNEARDDTILSYLDRVLVDERDGLKLGALSFTIGMTLASGSPTVVGRWLQHAVGGGGDVGCGYGWMSSRYRFDSA